ncbi:MAG: 1,4-dihydroxy-2-naphthoyl-CoA synthase [Gammaproteobacteria bacterium]|nr:MAG: 1,4-dihydroxy-2-naphthoyl-CoA synthase [Gammaproteobacteria bacterium]
MNNKIKWQTIKKYNDIKFSVFDGIAKISINRPYKHNAFTADTVMQMIEAMNYCKTSQDIAVIIITGEGGRAFCSGGDQSRRGKGGYKDKDNNLSLNVLDLQKLIRTIPKVVIAMVAGYAIGGGNVLQVVCDLSIASDNSIFGQTGPNVGSFDGGFGASYLARLVGQRKAREIWFLCEQYNARQALDMGLINKVVAYDKLEKTTIEWAQKIKQKSPLSIRLLKSAFNAELDGQTGIMELAGNSTLLYYLSEEANEGKQAFLEKRKPNFNKFPKFI